MIAIPHPCMSAMVGLQGRRLYVRLSGTLDYGLARSVDALLERHRGVAIVSLECSRVHDVDPTGAWLLARTLGGRRSDGSWIEIHGLPRVLRRQLMHHPLRTYCDPEQELFGDPDQEDARDLPTSRH